MKVVTIGRSEDDDIFIDDLTVSRHHLQIIQSDNGHYRLADFGSSNGTYVNGQKVSGEVDLNWHDIVRIGNTTLLWHDYFESDAPMNKGGGSGMVSGRETSPPQKKRNGFVTFFLILMTFNIFFAFYYLFAAREVMWTYPNSGHLDDMMFSEQPKLDLYYYSSYVMAMLSGLNGAAAVLLLLWKKIGFWLAVASAVCMFILMILFSAIGGVSPMVAFSMMGALLGPVVLWAILQIRRDGVSCWKLLS